MYRVTASLLPLLSWIGSIAAQNADFAPCSLLGPRFPIPRNTIASPIIQSGLLNLTAALDAYISTGDGEFGPITPNTTSFSIALFSIDESNSTKPFMYEYHHTTESVAMVDADSVYRVGDLTTLFTTWLFLIEAGEEYWPDPVSKWVPELRSNTSMTETIGRVNWDSVTLGDLAAHLGGIGQYNPDQKPLDPELAALIQAYKNDESSPCATESKICGRTEFLNYFNEHAPVFAPASTPIFSNAGFIILAYALETIKGRSFNEMLTSSILVPLNMSSSYLLHAPTNHSIIPSDPATSGWSEPLEVEAAFNGLYSSTSDVSAALRAIISSHLLDPAITNRWLKPITHTSNRANSVGRPWEIYSLTVNGASPVIPVYQVRGNVGLYSSHVGLVPDYGVGFVVLGADSEKVPDLNAYADLISVALIPALEENAIVQASQVFAGTYSAKKEGKLNEKVSLSIAQATDSSPGMALVSFTSGSQDIRAAYARLLDIEPVNLSLRIYPTDLVEASEQGIRMGFRAIAQDMSELTDAGTPTCDTWRNVDRLQLKGAALDKFVFDLREDEVVGVEMRALGLQLTKQ
ncbi:Nn.00g004200.m01.CDS01 [Neocucurbitaria sp. VM-36]